MSEQAFDRLETALRESALTFPYPPTPDLASAVRRRLATERPRGIVAPPRRLAWALALLALLAVGLLSVPTVRAGLIEILRIGAVRIRLIQPSATPTPPPTATAPAIVPPEDRPGSPTPRPSPTRRPTLTPQPLRSVLDLAGETTLEEAQAKAGFPILLPTYPAALGPPDKVYLQDLDGPAVVLVWLDPDDPSVARLSLHQLSSEAVAMKSNPPVLELTTVNGQLAAWTTGPYVLEYLRNGQIEWDLRRLVDGHVLIWQQGEITYRLETEAALDEARRIAESLR